MKSRESVDPNLHTLRTVIATLDGRAAQTLASARFHLYKAFENSDPIAAYKWIQALRAGFCTFREDSPREVWLHDLACEALNDLEAAL